MFTLSFLPSRRYQQTDLNFQLFLYYYHSFTFILGFIFTRSGLYFPKDNNSIFFRIWTIRSWTPSRSSASCLPFLLPLISFLYWVLMHFNLVRSLPKHGSSRLAVFLRYWHVFIPSFRKTYRHLPSKCDTLQCSIIRPCTCFSVWFPAMSHGPVQKSTSLPKTRYSFSSLLYPSRIRYT